MTDKEKQKEKVQKIQDMKKVLYKNLFIDTQFNEIINFYEHSHNLSTIEKEKVERFRQQIDEKMDKKQYNKVSSRRLWYQKIQGSLSKY